MICQNCGKENLEGSKFCEGCGTPLQAAPQPVEVPVQEPQTQAYEPAVESQQPQNPYAQQPQQVPQGQPYGVPYGAQQPMNNQPYGVPYGQTQPQNTQYGQPQNPQYGQPQNPQYGYTQPQPQPKKAPSIDINKIIKTFTEEVKGISKNALFKAISVLLVFVTVATMMMGWAKISMGDEAEDQVPVDVKVSTTLNVFQFKHVNSMIKDVISEAIDEVGDADDLPKEVKEIRLKTNITALILLVDMLVIALAILALAAYIFLSVTNNKSALYVGWASSILSVGAVIIYMVAFFVFNSILSTKISIIRLEDFVSLRLTLGMFLTLLSAAGNFALMFFKKDELKA